MVINHSVAVFYGSKKHAIWSKIKRLFLHDWGYSDIMFSGRCTSWAVKLAVDEETFMDKIYALVSLDYSE